MRNEHKILMRYSKANRPLGTHERSFEDKY